MLADPELRSEPLDNLKYIPLWSDDPSSYASLGLDLRDRVESTQIAPFGIGNSQTNTYLIQRLEIHADIHPDIHWQIFVQLQDDRAFGKDVITPVDKDPLDLEQAFATYTNEVGGGTLKVRVGRQQMGFDLQRFVGVRDGPNVRQSFDAVWADWEKSSWRFITFWSHPVQNVPDKTFNDYSSPRLEYGGFRIERDDVGPGSCPLITPGTTRRRRNTWMAAGTSAATTSTFVMQSREVPLIGTLRACGRQVGSATNRFEPGPSDRAADTRSRTSLGAHGSGCSSTWPQAIDGREMESSEPSIRCFRTHITSRWRAPPPMRI